jgi:5'-deoxynucleotidase YfbR-like HD superfamily hydrolase
MAEHLPVGTEAPPRAWVRLYSGKRLDLLDPTPFDWEDSDLAIGLARTYRWGGHSAWPLPLSVAQHCLLVLALRRQGSPGPADPRAELRELLHDADEGLLGFDCISVLKPFLGEAYRKLTARLEAAVVLRYRLPPWTAAEHRHHKRADRVAAATEAVHVVGWTEAEVRTTLKIPYRPLAQDPLAAIYGGPAFEPWPPTLAADRFLAELERLGAARSR